MVLKAAVKALKKAEQLKEKIGNAKDLLADQDVWTSQQQLQRVYQQVLILDLEYALDRKVEQELWSHGFRNFISGLQNAAKDKKNSKHSEAQAMLLWCLESASGFYLSLLQEICAAFNLDLPFRRKSSIYGYHDNKISSTHCQPNKNSCYYICQYCLVHLGDIARYRNQSRQAEMFYRYAVQLSPTSGQPYNQLAILEASRGDRLSTVYHYVRSVAVCHPFAAAATNLSRTFEKHAEEVMKVEGHTKLSSTEYTSAFLKLQGLLHCHTELDVAERLVQVLTTSLTAHIATESLSSWKLVQMVTIIIFAWNKSGADIPGQAVPGLQESEDMALTKDEQRERHLLCDLLASCLCAFLLPVYTIKEGEPLLSYFVMPAINLTLEWIRLEPDILKMTPFKERLQIWPSLCKLLNGLQPTIAEFSSDKYTHVPLPEDIDLQGFLPLSRSHQDLKFSTEDLKGDTTALNRLRASRLVQFGRWLAEQGDLNLMSCTRGQAGTVFEAVGRPEAPSGELLRELQEMSLTKVPSPTPSEGSGSVTGASTPDSSGFLALGNPTLRSSDFSSQENLDKKPGILKSQPEKSPTEKVGSEKPPQQDKQVTGPSTRNQRNVALLAIMKKNYEETKQVTFKTPSPPLPDLVAPGKKPTSKQVKNTQEPKPEKTSTKKEARTAKKSSETRQEDGKKETLTPQQKLMEVLNPKQGKKNEKGKKTEKAKVEKGKKPNSLELDGAFPPLPSTRDSARDIQTVSMQTQTTDRTAKQQLLSELFGKERQTEADTQQQHLSGLLNLNKQQQQMLTDSKKTMVVQKTADKMEAAKKEYEAAMFALQQQQQQQQQQDLSRYSNRGVCEPPPVFEGMEARQGVAQVPQAPAHQHAQQHAQHPQPMLLGMPQPVMNVPPPLAFKYPPQMFVPWQEPEQPPMPPAWWSEPRHQVSAENFVRPHPPPDAPMFSSPAHQAGFPAMSVGGSTYSLFSTTTWNTMRDGDPEAGYPMHGSMVPQQSFWSGPGPSPLERLLEQQKQMRENPGQPKSGT